MESFAKITLKIAVKAVSYSHRKPPSQKFGGVPKMSLGRLYAVIDVWVVDPKTIYVESKLVLNIFNETIDTLWLKPFKKIFLCSFAKAKE